MTTAVLVFPLGSIRSSLRRHVKNESACLLFPQRRRVVDPGVGREGGTEQIQLTRVGCGSMVHGIAISHTDTGGRRP